uniref:S1 motif domain-containing protein n=1 Tax=Alexandrium catenella TaxID=2925 RepID=A0A7S1LXY9_ALECA|mmetsp:Transcript_1576/g.4342  ORF Transcript_1576/g.4342 Transcript_1576/m.4342 type:complete len:241 (+) Transcript_1576:82-804(+)
MALQRSPPAAGRPRLRSSACLRLGALLVFAASQLELPVFVPSSPHCRLGRGTCTRAAAGTAESIDLEIGQEVEGTVRKSLPFGAFVTIDGSGVHALVRTGEQQEGIPTKALTKDARVKGRVLDVKDGRVQVTLRPGSLERTPEQLGHVKLTSNSDRNVDFSALPQADEWAEGEVCGILLRCGAQVKVMLPGQSEPVVGVVRIRDFADGLAGTVTYGAKVRVRPAKVDFEQKRVEFTMKQP